MAVLGRNARGIEEKLPYLASLGVTVLYLNPIFEAASNHRYDTADYTRVDPLLGRKKDFESLCEAARKRGIRIVLDGVFNHTGADSVYFDKFGNYGTAEKYRSWFRFGDQYRHGYECWWDVPDLPNVEENDPSFREFLCGEDGVVRRWLRRGASGWRLDVADELPDSLIRDIRAAMKEEKEDSLLLGEVWEDASNKVSYGALREYFLGSELDATMHYPFRTAVLDFLLGKIHAQAACDAFWTIQEHYPKENLYAALNLIGSHDRARVLTVLGGDVNALKMAMFLQFALPGVPSIYYGDEAGMTGGTDPYNRGSFPWGKGNARSRILSGVSPPCIRKRRCCGVASAKCCSSARTCSAAAGLTKTAPCSRSSTAEKVTPNASASPYREGGIFWNEALHHFQIPPRNAVAGVSAGDRGDLRPDAHDRVRPRRGHIPPPAPSGRTGLIL